MEDDETVSSMLEHMLKIFGFNAVITAFTTEKALELWNQNWNNIDVVLMDLNQPGSVMTQEDLIKKIKGCGFSGPIITMSGKTLRNTVEMGCTGIHKPFGMKTLRKAVQPAIDRWTITPKPAP